MAGKFQAPTDLRNGIVPASFAKGNDLVTGVELLNITVNYIYNIQSFKGMTTIIQTKTGIFKMLHQNKQVILRAI